MSNQAREGSKIKLSWILLILVVAFVAIAAVGITVWRNAATQLNAQSKQENKVSDSASKIADDRIAFQLSEKPQQTVAAPAPPTPISTSLPNPTEIPLPTLENPPLIPMEKEAALIEAEFINLNSENTGIWQFQSNTFIHPIALEISGSRAFLLDGGRVLVFDLDNPGPPQQLLEPGVEISGVRVLEPLDLASTNSALLVLDRAGDVYRYDLTNHTWQIDRYDRPVEASSGHYFVALDQVENVDNQVESSNNPTALLETNYKFTMLYGGDSDSLWNLPEGRSIDLTVRGEDVYVLQRAMHDNTGSITKYVDTRSIESFKSQIEIEQPRQIVATASTVYVLDQNGRRLRALDPSSGKMLRLYQLPQYDPASAFAVTGDEQLVLAARDRLYFFDRPQQLKVIFDTPTTTSPQAHDPKLLATLDEYTVPIGGSNITFRDFQLPGAPRHYRLGVHQGIDFYWQPGTKILATADGTVIRADKDYIPPSAFQLSAWWTDSQERGYTSAETLDKYLGRQVWIQHDGGFVSRYAHLRSIEPDINEGTLVKRGQVIGEVGNSGSPSSLESESADAHLHFELWIGEHYLGQFLRPVEVREWVEKIFVQRN